MKTFFYMGTNPENRSGFSWKIWKVERQGKTVQAWWGPARVLNRKPVPAGILQTKKWRFRTEREAIEEESRRIQEKLRKGYKRVPRRNCD
jgi:hypothetical protein